MTEVDGARRAGLSNLQLRVISALCLAVAVLALTWLGGWPFRLLAVGISALIFYEWSAMSRVANDTRHLAFGWVFLAGILVATAAGATDATLLILVGVAVLVCGADALLRRQGAWGVTGLVYAALSGLSLAHLRNGDAAGLVAVIFLFSTVWSTDILAFFVGRAVGGPKLAPSISPGKTWSGAVGGAAAGLVGGVLVVRWGGAQNLAGFMALALVLSIASQAGDLFESWVKRQWGAKDSGALIPGHGGVMDRVDGLVAAAIVLSLAGALWNYPDETARSLFAF